MPRRRPPCRHCKRRPAGQPGGLCEACFARPEIRLQYLPAVAAPQGPKPTGPRYRPQKKPR